MASNIRDFQIDLQKSKNENRYPLSHMLNESHINPEEIMHIDMLPNPVPIYLSIQNCWR